MYVRIDEFLEDLRYVTNHSWEKSPSNREVVDMVSVALDFSLALS